MGNNDYVSRWNNNKIASVLLTAFFLVSLIEIIAEYNQDKYLVWLTKPLILPLLMAYYFRRSKKVNPFFIAALFFCWVANIFFIENSWNYILLGVSFFLVYRILIISIVLKKVKAPGLIPLIVGCIPFVFTYAAVTIFTFSVLGDSLFLFLIQGVFTVFLGGLSLGNYILYSNKTNRMLFVSTMLFAFNQFIFLLRFYFEETNLFQAVAMIFFVWGQFLLTKFMLNSEKNKNRYLIVNKLSETNK